ncbi:hypothetical protein BST43_12015 [Mycobacteroides saopaulense]|uniref:Uncharacterized protein n=1 Tax=Mycobacteroides saopaulense TaxID=1578165 RepID=A0A1X0J8U7_9MYCO|nr:hypothetical protein [Mycobacteroides saopaulense]ORB57972.1 hypothetical protein BST43_12015 [Mycobacteroides saopaulense]
MLAYVIAKLAVPDGRWWASAPTLGIGFLFAVYIATVNDSALITQVNEALDGVDPSIHNGFSTVATRRRQLAPWVLATAIATYALNSIDGWVVGTLAGGLWLSVTLLVLPTITLENVGGIVGIANALDHFRRNWTRCLLGSALLTVTSVALMSAGLGLLVLKPESTGLMLLLSILALMCLLPAVVYALALILVYQTVLYRELVATRPD